MGVVIGVDSSTGATKVEVRDADDGRLLASGRAPHPVTTPPVSEVDPERWWDALGTALAAAGARAGTASGISVAAQQHGLVAIAADGTAVRPAKLWNDTESAPDARWLHDRLGGPAAWAAACGSVPVAAFTIAKLSWLHRQEPEAFDRMTRVALPHDWLTWRLTGRFVTDRGDASGTGYWSAREGRYRTDLLEVVDGGRDWSRALPEVLGPADPAGTTRAFGMRDAVVGPGTGDNMAAALGVGLAPGDVAVSLGTSGTVFATSEVGTADPSGAVAGFADATGRFLPLVCTLNATKVTDAFARVLGVDAAGLASLALEAPVGSGGLVLVPYLDGERTPDRPGASGTLGGLRSDVTRSQVARAAHEGVVCGLLDGLDALDAAGVATAGGRLLLVGGGSRSPAFRRVLADLTGREVVVPDAPEHVAAGACVQAAAVVHGRPPEEVAAAWGLGRGTIVEPDRPRDAGQVEQLRTAYAAARDASSGTDGSVPGGQRGSAS